MADELKAGTQVLCPVPVMKVFGHRAFKQTEIMQVGRIEPRIRNGVPFTRDCAGQYMVRIGTGLSPHVVVAFDDELVLT